MEELEAGGWRLEETGGRFVYYFGLYQFLSSRLHFVCLISPCLLYNPTLRLFLSSHSRHPLSLRIKMFETLLRVPSSLPLYFCCSCIPLPLRISLPRFLSFFHVALIFFPSLVVKRTTPQYKVNKISLK